jgi:hypothetical protein
VPGTGAVVRRGGAERSCGAATGKGPRGGRRGPLLSARDVRATSVLWQRRRGEGRRRSCGVVMWPADAVRFAHSGSVVSMGAHDGCVRLSSSGRGRFATERHRMLSVTSLVRPRGPAFCRAPLPPVVHPLTSIVGDMAHSAQPVRQTSAPWIFVTLRKVRLVVGAGSAEAPVRRVARRHPRAGGDSGPGRDRRDQGWPTPGVPLAGHPVSAVATGPLSPAVRSQRGREVPRRAPQRTPHRAHGLGHSHAWSCLPHDRPRKEAGARPWRGHAPVRSSGTTILLPTGHALGSQHVPDGLLL